MHIGKETPEIEIKIELVEDEAKDFFFMEVSEPYIPIGRELLWAKQIEKEDVCYNENSETEHGVVVFNRDIATCSYVITKRGCVSDMFAEGEQCAIPTFEIATNPMAKLNQRVAIKRLEQKGRQSIAQQEDREILRCIGAAVPENHSVYCKSFELGRAFDAGISLIEAHLLKVDKLVCHPNLRANLSRLVKAYNEENPDRPIRLIVCVMCPDNAAYFLAAKEYVGRMPIRQDVAVLEVDDPKALRKGLVVYEEIGVAVINEYATSKLIVRDEEVPQFPNERLTP